MNMPQQVFLRDAMRILNMTRESFSQRIGCTKRALDTWLLPDESSEFRAMPEMARRFISEILAAGDLRARREESGSSALRGKEMPPRGFGRLSHLLSVAQFSRESGERLFALADIMQPIARRRKVSRVLEGAVLANLFFEASTRTRLSFASAFMRLGGSVCDTTGFTYSSMAKGESIGDTSRTVSGYADVLVVRHPEQGSVAQFASATHVPVINGGDGAGEHPTQALIDLYTIQREFSRLGKLIDGSHIVITGDLKYGRTAHSLVQMLSLYRRMRFTLVSPPSLEMPEEITQLIALRGHDVEVSHSLERALQGADVIYTTRIQRERLTGETIDSFLSIFEINKKVVNQYCKNDVIVMHPLPRDSRPGAYDLNIDLDGDTRLAIFRQTDNGVPIRMAIFATILGVDGLVQGSLREANWAVPETWGPDDVLDIDSLEVGAQ
ncbi:aspartate carbamoyltransferase [Herbaspirillum camelliae]|uniref:aspartate carbamoyltransferase n=1 Tax=Herbaspirillum camelliae TaxID=1892903 RepID=UPI00094A1307|nr:aspartate carbamoyltransferase [Herbaspirillum camelliae]